MNVSDAVVSDTPELARVSGGGVDHGEHEGPTVGVLAGGVHGP